MRSNENFSQVPETPLHLYHRGFLYYKCKPDYENCFPLIDCRDRKSGKGSGSEFSVIYKQKWIAGRESFSICQMKLLIMYCREEKYHLETYVIYPKHAQKCGIYVCQMNYGEENSIRGKRDVMQ